MQTTAKTLSDVPAINRFLSYCRVRTVPSKTVMIHAGDLPDVLYYIVSHLDRLPVDDAKSRAIVKQMRDEEKEHGENAIDAGAAELPDLIQRLMKLTAKVMTSTAYRV